jgi:hypothetical protein
MEKMMSDGAFSELTDNVCHGKSAADITPILLTESLSLFFRFPHPFSRLSCLLISSCVMASGRAQRIRENWTLVG